MVATVEGSMGVAAGAGAACFSALVLLDCSVFLLQATVSSRAPRASVLTDNIFQFVFLFMMSTFLELEALAHWYRVLRKLVPSLRDCSISFAQRRAEALG